MSNSHPLHPFFTPFKPVAQPLLAVVAATVPFFFPTVSETVPSNWRIYLLRGLEQPPTTCNSSSNLLLPAANTAIARATGQYGCQRRFLARGGAVWKRRQERICRGGQLRHVVGNCRKRKQEEVKRTYRKDRGEEEDGAQGKSGRGTARVGSAAVSAR